jgi:hypothetical protein
MANTVDNCLALEPYTPFADSAFTSDYSKTSCPILAYP